jgi:hypothetical protein
MRLAFLAIYTGNIHTKTKILCLLSDFSLPSVRLSRYKQCSIESAMKVGLDITTPAKTRQNPTKPFKAFASTPGLSRKRHSFWFTRLK